jgi:DNA-binding transcriptional ArsR family regulator
MVLENAEKLDGVFHALSDPTRRAMLRTLVSGERKIGDLAAPFSMSFVAASKHVRVLERAGLVRRRIDGRAHVCSIETAPLFAATEWLRFYEQFWAGRLDTLEDILKAEDAAVTQPGSEETEK